MALLRHAHGCFMLALTLLIGLTLASPTKDIQSWPNTLQRRETVDGVLDCKTERSSDYYGLGVRLGIYFAWIQAWIANTGVPSEIGGAMDTNAVFLFAVLMAMIRCTITGMLWQADGLILMHIGGGTIFSVLSLWGYRTCTYYLEGPKEGVKKYGGWGTHLRLLISMGIACYGFYFWVWGIKGSLKGHPDEGCEVVYTFFFSKLRADGGIRYFYILIVTSCMIYFGIMILASLVALPSRLHRIVLAHRSGDAGKRLRHRFVTGLSQRRYRQIFYFLRVGNGLFIIYSMLLVEFSLNFNNMASVLGSRADILLPSQMIPLIIGIFGFCKVIWVRYREWKAPDYLNSNTGRTILHTSPKELVRIYSPSSNVTFESVRLRSGGEIHPVIMGQPTWLRLLVTYLPWLGVLRWWKPDRTFTTNPDRQKSEKHSDPETPGALDDKINDNDGWSSTDTSPRLQSSAKPTPQVTQRPHRNMAANDDTIGTAPELQLPQIPRNIARFGKL